MIRFRTSGSVRSASSVDPTRSQNSAATMRRRGAASCAESRSPHALQNLAGSGFEAPHIGHVRTEGVSGITSVLATCPDIGSLHLPASPARPCTTRESDGSDRHDDGRSGAVPTAARPGSAAASVPRPGARVGVPCRSVPPPPGEHPLRLPGRDRPLDLVGPAPAPLHPGPLRTAARPDHAVGRVHPDAGRRPRAHVHAVLRPDLGMGRGRHRDGDDRARGCSTPRTS